MSRRRLATLALLAGCGRWEASAEDGFEVLRRTFPTGADGKAFADVEVDDQDKLLVTAVTEADDVTGWLGAVEAPDGGEVYTASDWWRSPYGLTNAGFASHVVVGNWPITAEDPPLSPGTWRLELHAQEANTDLDVTVLLGRDDDLARGALEVELVYAADLESETKLKAGVQDALAIWADDIYGPIGIDVSFTEREWDGPARLASPGYGDAAAYLDAVASKPLGKVTILVVRLVTDASHVLGVAGGIPGALVATDRSVVTVAAEEAAGTSFTFDAARTRLLAETLAHEVGHFLGLFHPVELPTSGTAAKHWDALSDTPECVVVASDGDCITDLGGNLMFPTPVCGGSSCLPQQTLTDDQQGVLQRYTGVR